MQYNKVEEVLKKQDAVKFFHFLRFCYLTILKKRMRISRYEYVNKLLFLVITFFVLHNSISAVIFHNRTENFYFLWQPAKVLSLRLALINIDLRLNNSFPSQSYTKI
jgi:hypothetical protein